jgi:molybdate transport system regulatory protein
MSDTFKSKPKSRSESGPRPKSKPGRPALKGSLFLQQDERQSFTQAQIDLLNAIASAGSISGAARAAGVSYKTAWDRIDAMNNLSTRPLVARSAGGARGGGTQLTDFGQQVLNGFNAIQEQHAEFVDRLGEQVQELDDVADFLNLGKLKTSARNQYRGRVSKLTRGAVNAEVELALSDSIRLVTIITNDSVERMELAVGCEAIALIKSSWVLLCRDSRLRTSARNQLGGIISQVTDGEVNAEVTLDLGDGKTLTAMVTSASLEDLEMEVGDSATALFKASSVILMRA